MGFPVSCGESLAAYIADDKEGHDLLNENAIVKAERVGVQVEVALCWRVVCGLVLGPYNTRKGRGRFALRDITEIIKVRWVHPKCTAVWHWRHADITW